MKFTLLVIIGLVVLMTGFADKEDAQQILELQGFTQINVIGYAFVGCDEKDFTRTEFKAISPEGLLVRGAVCAPLFSEPSVVVR